MLAKEADNFMNRVRHALTLPIRTRCAELTVLFDRGAILELQNFYPLLIDSIFGPQGTLSWGLRTITIGNNLDEDFNQLQHFLSPCGPVFKLIYTLLKNSSIKYDFPLLYLPKKIQQILENAQMYPFYADLVHINPQTKQVISLLLNPFDYYIFHFAYHLINPWHQRTGTFSNNASWNTVYHELCCDYMLHFFPTDANCRVLPIIFYNGKSPVQQLQNINRLQISSHLINMSNLSKSVEEYSFQQNFGKHPRNEIWRSETVLTVFVDLWFTNDQVSQPVTQINNSFNNSPINKILHYNELPNAEYMRIVRALIKQLHAFSASAKFDDTHMCELKKIAIPMLQGKFYIFLRNLIHRWPLDGSFRLVLELWLTYIQPWRYLPNNNNTNKYIQNKHASNNMDLDEVPTHQKTYSVSREYLPFIAENILVYIVIFQQLLPRFSRVDLVSPKMAVMLYRITKVFSQTHLGDLLREIEKCIENNHSPTHHSYNSHWKNNLPPLNPTTNWCTNSTSQLNNSNCEFNSRLFLSDTSFNNNTSFTTNDRKWSAIVRQKIYELEGPNFCYKPLFTQIPANEVYELILQIKQSIKLSQELVEMKKQELDKLYSGFWGFLKSLWETSPSDEFSLKERIKVPAYLDVSLQNLMELFKIEQLPELPSDMSYNSNSTSNVFELSNIYKLLTPKNVRERMKQIKYEGDPDLHPIRSNEVVFLVRMFYQFAQKLNENYGELFCRLYYSPKYLGRLSRQILQPPITIYKYDKTKLGSPRISTDLQPRISFRRFASYQFLSYLFLGGLFTYLFFGYGIFTYFFIIFVVSMIYKCIKAIPATTVRHNYPTEGFGNISFNDSF